MIKKIKNLLLYWINVLIDPTKLARGPIEFLGYLKDWIRYSKMEGAEPIKLINTYPCLYEKTSTTAFDSHYFYQDIWAFRKIFESKCKLHVDVGSKISFIGLLSVITNVTFIDIRPLLVNLESLNSKKGSILSMPYNSNSIDSLSCLHVAEHIGLGRYGDSLDPMGTKKAAEELTRVLKPNGNLYFSLPIGKPKLCFNAHRIHSTEQILSYFSSLHLIELSGVDDNGNFIQNINKKILDSCEFGCGFFWFTKI